MLPLFDRLNTGLLSSSGHSSKRTCQGGSGGELVGRQFAEFAPADLVHCGELQGGRESRSVLAFRSSIHRNLSWGESWLCENANSQSAFDIQPKFWSKIHFGLRIFRSSSFT